MKLLFLKPVVFSGITAAAILTFSGAVFPKSGGFKHTAMAAQGWEKTPLQSTKIQAVQTSSQGILAGEYDTRIWLNPFNGIYISKDLGKNWRELALSGRGVKDIAINNGKIYTATYYFQGGTAGLFISNDRGKTWGHSGGNFSASVVSANQDTIALGTYSHGLWVSIDNGNSWEQKIGDGFHGPQIFSLDSTKDLITASLSSSTYKSTDGGQTWQEIYGLRGVSVRSIKIQENFILAGASNGLYRSTDSGSTWKKVSNWGDYATGAVTFHKNTFYAGRYNPLNYKFDLYKSVDFGLTWESTGLNPMFSDGNITDIAWLFSEPSYLFAAVPSEGIYKYAVPKKPVSSNPFLEAPWKKNIDNDLVDKIYSFFDHEYPFLGYDLHSEPPEAQNTTMNFLGKRESEPHIYYSSHDGTDFTLNYGTSVLAAAGGKAGYIYTSGLGHTIKIDHQNGYQTVYGHLQGIDLASPSWVDAGQQVGLIGMSGMTTGPHLHFEVTKDLNLDGDFENDEPGGRIDPFGWLNETSQDPWPVYVWEDINGQHQGSQSLYLWRTPVSTIAQYIQENGGEITLDNKKVIIEQNSSEDNFTVFITPYSTPRFPIAENRFTYLTGTSFITNLYNNLGEEPPPPLKPIKIEIDFSNANLDTIKENTLKIYHWNEEAQKWEAIPSVLDLVNKVIVGETTEFSHFAVLGEPKDQFKDKAVIQNVQIKINF